MSVSATSLASCFADRVICSITSRSSAFVPGSFISKSSLRPRTSVIGVLNSWLATSMNAVFNWLASSRLALS